MARLAHLVSSRHGEPGEASAPQARGLVITTWDLHYDLLVRFGAWIVEKTVCESNDVLAALIPQAVTDTISRLETITPISIFLNIIVSFLVLHSFNPRRSACPPPTASAIW